MKFHCRVYSLVAERSNFDANINVSVFETNIRIVGGLLSAHLMARRAGVPLEKGTLAFKRIFLI